MYKNRYQTVVYSVLRLEILGHCMEVSIYVRSLKGGFKGYSAYPDRGKCETKSIEGGKYIVKPIRWQSEDAPILTEIVL